MGDSQKNAFFRTFSTFCNFFVLIFSLYPAAEYKDNDLRAAILEMSEILKLPKENKVILKLFFESVTASSRPLRGLRRLNKPGTAKPDFRHLRELKTLPNPNRARKNEISRMASGTKWGKISRTRFQFKDFDHKKYGRNTRMY